MCSIQEINDVEKTFELQDSEITIGRGPFLGVTDKRVSRNHGTLKRLENGIELKSIHINPCFYTINSDEKWLRLDKNESVVLKVGDTFSLLPKQYIYKVIDHEQATNDPQDHDAIGSGHHIEACNAEDNVDTDTKTIEAALNGAGVSSVEEKLSKDDDKTSNQSNDENRPQTETQLGDLKKLKKDDSAKFQVKLANESKTINDDSAKIPSRESEKSGNGDNKHVKIHPNSSKTPKKENLMDFYVKKSVTKSPNYVRRGTVNTYMDGQKEVALPSDTKRKLPSWMKQKSAETTTNPSTTTKKSSNKTARTPKRPSSKKRRMVQKVDFDSDETPNELEPPALTSDAEKSDNNDDIINVIVKEDDVTGNNDIMPDTTSVVADPAAVRDYSETTTTNDVTSEDVEMVDASVAMGDGGDRDDDVMMTSSGENVSILPQTADDAAATTTRESCPYGSSCYRKNPAHFVELSHPGDDDYEEQKSDDESERPECPYGTSCYRKNLDHQRQYKHTKRMAPKRHAKTQTSKKKDDDESSSDEYDLDDSFLNEEGDDDITDVSDGDSDWNPDESQPREPTRKSKRSQKKTSYHDSNSEDEATDEDLNDLVSDAKDFTTNRKMWKK